MYISLADTWNLTSKLTFKKVKNAYRIYSSFQQAKRSHQPVIRGLPISMSIEPTTACNLRCPECPSGLRSFTRPTGKIDSQLFESTLNQVSDTLAYLTFYFQGEPYLHPEFLQMVNMAAERGIYTATSTNGHFLSEENARKTVLSGLDRLIISIDGATQETYEAYRKTGNLDQVLEGTRTILKWKKQLRSATPHVVWQFLVVRPNEHEIPTIRKMAAEFGVDGLVFKSAQVYDYKNGNELIPKDTAYSRYIQKEDGIYSPKAKIDNECWRMWHSCVMTWDGRIVPCCFDKDGQYEMGNVKESSFGEIWNSARYEAFRGQLLTARAELEMCKNCTEGAKVWV